METEKKKKEPWKGEDGRSLRHVYWPCQCFLYSIVDLGRGKKYQVCRLPLSVRPYNSIAHSLEERGRRRRGRCWRGQKKVGEKKDLSTTW